MLFWCFFFLFHLKKCIIFILCLLFYVWASIFWFNIRIHFFSNEKPSWGVFFCFSGFFPDWILHLYCFHFSSFLPFHLLWWFVYTVTMLFFSFSTRFKWNDLSRLSMCSVDTEWILDLIHSLRPCLLSFFNSVVWEFYFLSFFFFFFSVVSGYASNIELKIGRVPSFFDPPSPLERTIFYILFGNFLNFSRFTLCLKYHSISVHQIYLLLSFFEQKSILFGQLQTGSG